MSSALGGMDTTSFCDLAMPGVQRLQAYQPGKPIEELQRELGLDDIVKLASNENPLGPSRHAVAAARESLANVHRYPDGNGYRLKQRLADLHDIDPAGVTLGNGSNDVLDMVARAFLGPGRNAVFSQHAFAVYPIATQSVGADMHIVPALGAEASQPYGHDLDAMRAAIDERTSVVFVANPNNPTGTWVGRDALHAFLASVPARVMVVVDEAYIEYGLAEPGFPNAMRWIREFPNLIVTRTFSKAYGLAGLRVGYGVSHPEVADLLNRVRHPFNVSIPALTAAEVALDDTAHIEESVALNREQGLQLREALASMGFACLPSAANFLTVEVGDRAEDVYQGLLQRGVIVRPVGGGYGLPRHLRVTIGLSRENQRFLSALSELRQEGFCP